MNDFRFDPAQSTRFGALGFTALALGLAATTGYLALKMIKAGGYSNEPTRLVVVAAHNVEAGRPLSDSDLKLVAWPASSIPAGAVGDKAALLGPQPRVPTSGLVQGEPILAGRLASAQAGPGLAALVPAESRAVAIKVDKDVAAARLLYPGARVDLLVSLRGITRTVLEDARVLAVGTYADIDAARRGEGRSSTRGPLSDGFASAEAVVTLEVSPVDAERVSLATREGKVDLVLRNASDRSTSSSRGTTIADFFRGVPGIEMPSAKSATPASKSPPVAQHSTPKKVARPSTSTRTSEPPTEDTQIRVQ